MGNLFFRELPLKPGDWCLLYTDGIPETANPAGVEFGTDRFKQFLETDAKHLGRSFCRSTA